MNKNIALISFYNPKSLGLRYIENALLDNGYTVRVIFFKDFNSVDPRRATDTELLLLKETLSEFNPFAIGLSIMASMYLETVYAVNDMLKMQFPDTPIIWGGVYPTMFPEDSMAHANYVLKGEGEEPFVKLLNALTTQSDIKNINNLVYRNENEEIIINDLNMLITDLDEYGIPDIGSSNKFFIEEDLLKNVDPQINAFNYELSASRGCPFACTYCCSINLARLSGGKGAYVRFRTVDRVIEEVKLAMKKVRKLKVIHFWDEIFCDDEAWIDEFVEKYKKEVNLPFEIWGHPLRTNESIMKKLVDAGLYKVVMGIQSGSPYIRKEIFRRPETQEEIISASHVLSSVGVPQVIYDFMLRHPFETHETLKETYDFCLELTEPFELQLHGLNFLPGTDIVDKALEMGLVEPDEMQKLMYAPIKDQYDLYWDYENDDEIMNFWYHMIYLTQFPKYKKRSLELAKDPLSLENQEEAKKLYDKGQIKSKTRYYFQKGKIVLRGTFK